ncbi:MAG TPA: 4Fe-4S binding protein [Rhodospirillaceae bacterium]|nr:4Fe-4S binding protein [Rhodospirillaceae bacterium]
MKVNGTRVLVCSCNGSMSVDARRLAEALEAAGTPEVHTQLCRAEAEKFRAHLAAGEPLLVCCTQEAPRFTELAGDAATPAFVDIRDRAGWTDQAGRAAAKMAALIAEALLPPAIPAAVPLSSDGATLVYAGDDVGVDAARRLAADRRVTCLLVPPAELLEPPGRRDFALLKGRVTAARGHLGAFQLTVDGLAAAAPWSRAALVFDQPAESGELTAEVILDLSGQPPLFSGRDGYLRADPGAPAAVERALAEAALLRGQFDKPRYVRIDPGRCAHSRNGQLACTRCLDACPSSAITADGDHVSIDAHACSGHGACASVCPTAAITYQMPPALSAFERLRVLLATYRRAGGGAAEILVHDPRHGLAMIQALARHDRGLPAAVIPYELNEVTAMGLDFALTALAYGASRLSVLLPPGGGGDSLRQTMALAEEIVDGLGLGGGRLSLLEDSDPAALGSLLRRALPPPLAAAATHRALGQSRETLVLALEHLHGLAAPPPEVLPLAGPAPFGQVLLDGGKCTLCMACVGVCPTAALSGNADKPQLAFHEASCVQCQLCRVTCPEHAIQLERRLAFGPLGSRRRILKEEEPYPCIRCGKAFGVRSMVERMVERLTGHPMYRDPGRLDLIRMCDDCRVIVQWGGEADPSPRPRPITSDDYRKENP